AVDRVPADGAVLHRGDRAGHHAQLAQRRAVRQRMPGPRATSDATTAKLLLLALAFCWGLSWAAMRIALYEVSPWTLRFLGYTLGAITLLILLKAQGRSLAIPRGRHW